MPAAGCARHSRRCGRPPHAARRCRGRPWQRRRGRRLERCVWMSIVCIAVRVLLSSTCCLCRSAWRAVGAVGNWLITWMAASWVPMVWLLPAWRNDAMDQRACRGCCGGIRQQNDDADDAVAVTAQWAHVSVRVRMLMVATTFKDDKPLVQNTQNNNTFVSYQQRRAHTLVAIVTSRESKHHGVRP